MNLAENKIVKGIMLGKYHLYRVFENRVLSRIFGSKKKAVTIVMEESIYLKRSPIFPSHLILFY